MPQTTYSKGKYQAEVLDQGFEESANKGTPGFFVQAKILGRYDSQGGLEECPQYERTCHHWLAGEVGVHILRSVMHALGVTITDLTQLEPGTPNHVSLVGRKIDMVCILENYQGRLQERWSIPRNVKRLDREAIRRLDDEWGHVLRGTGVQAKPDPAVPSLNDSDTPF